MGDFQPMVKKINCIILILFLISAMFSSITLAEDGGDDPIGDDTEGKSKSASRTTLRGILRDVLEQRRAERKGIFSLKVVTNYKGIEKSTRLRALLPTIINIDNDDDNDIRVWVFRRPAVELLPPAIAMKTTLLVRRLPGMDDIKNDSFEIYLEYMPKVISSVTGVLDRIRIGYQSPDGEEVPKSCLVSHKTIPHFIYPRQEPTHVFSINPSSIAGKYKLNFIASIADMDGETVLSQHLLKINCNPMVNTEVSLRRFQNNKRVIFNLETSGESTATICYSKEENGHEASLGLHIDKLSSFTCELALTTLFKKISEIEYRRVGSNPVNVTLFKENNDQVYFYVKHLPDYIHLSWLPEFDGWMEINASEDAIEKVGFCNDLLDPTWDFYVINFPVKAKLQWDMSQESDSDENRLSISSGTEGCSAHLEATVNNPLHTSINMNISTKNNINVVLSWDLSKNLLRLEHSETDLNVSLLISDDTGNMFAGSCLLKHRENESLTIIFDKLFTDDIGLSLAGTYFDLYDVDMHLYLQGVGNFTATMDRLLKNNSGSFNMSFHVSKNGDFVLCNCTLEIVGGIELQDVHIGYNGFWYNASSVIVGENDTLYFEFGGELDIVYEFANDFSWGYIFIKGSAYMNLDISFNWNGTDGGIKGEIYLQSHDDAFNISWTTVDGQKKFTLNGSALLQLSDFHTWFGDIFDVSIPELSGSFMLENASEQEGFFTFEFEGSGFLRLNTSFTSENESDVLLNVSLDAQIESGESPASIAVAWDDYNVTSFEIRLEDRGTLIINDLDMQHTEDGNTSLTVENLTAFFTGYLAKAVIATNETNETVVFTLEDAEIFLHIDDVNISSRELDLGECIFSSHAIGRAEISLLNFSNYSYQDPNLVENLSRYNVTMSITASNRLDLDTFYIEHLGNYSTVSMKNLSIVGGHSEINISVVTNPLLLAARFINIFIDNGPGTTLLLDDFSFDLVLSTPNATIPPIPTTLYRGKLVEGVLDLHLRLFDILAVEIANGSAIDYLGVNVTPPEELGLLDFHFHVYFEEAVDYLNFDVNVMIVKREHILIDTNNITTKLNLSLIVPQESGNDIGFRIDNVTLQADNFTLHTPKIFWDPQNASTDDFTIEGYIHLEGEGTIWLLLNGTWHPLYQYIGTLTIRPGHLVLEVDGEITLNHTIVLTNGDAITINGNFTADDCLLDLKWNRTESNTTITYNGSLDIDNFLFKIEYNITDGESWFQMSGDFSISILEFASISIRDSSFDVNLSDGELHIDDFHVMRVNNSELTFDVSWSSFFVSGPAYVFIDLDVDAQFSLYGFTDSFDVTDFYLAIIDQNLELDSIHFSGELNLSTLPEKPDTFDYIGVNVIYINGTIEISGIASTSFTLDNLEYVYFEGTGDIRFENWMVYPSDDMHLRLETQNGLTINSFLIEFDPGSRFNIERSGSAHGDVGEGFFHAAWNIDGDGDGFVYLNSSYIIFDDVSLVYLRDGLLDWGIRVSFPDDYIDANEWRVEWDPLYYSRILGIYIPYNWQISGNIDGDIDIDITDGNHWYNLYPYCSDMVSSPLKYYKFGNFYIANYIYYRI
jgi:hypothetical protein